MTALSKKQRAALVVIQAQHTTNPGSWVLAQAVGGRSVSPTLRSLVRRGLIEWVERTDIRSESLKHYAARITDAGRQALL